MFDIFNTREVASLLIFTIFIFWAIYKIEDKESIFVQFYDLFFDVFSKEI